TDVADFDHEALRRCSQSNADSLVCDPAVARHKRQGFAEVFRRRGDVEEDPRITQIGLLGQVQTESGVLDRFRGAVEDSDLSRRRYAMMEGIALRQVATFCRRRASIACLAASPIVVGRPCGLASSVTSTLPLRKLARTISRLAHDIKTPDPPSVI